MKSTPRHVQVTPKYTYHDEPHSFEQTVDYVVVASNTSTTETQDLNENNLSPPTKGTGAIIGSDNENEIHYSNSHFKFEVLETTV